MLPDLLHLAGPMPSKFNAATRLRDFLAQVPKKSNDAASAVWAQVFGISHAGNSHQHFEVADRLGLLADELRAIESRLRPHYSAPLFDPGLSVFTGFFSPGNLDAPWASVRGRLTEEALAQLAFWCEMLPDEEDKIDSDVLDELVVLLADLKERATDPTISDGLRILIQRHIALMEQAFRDYSVSGVEAFKDAAVSAVGELMVAKPEVKQDAEKSGVLESMGKLWKRVNSVADAVTKTDKMWQIGQKAWEALDAMTKGPGA